jgi:hypothetical protein
MTVAEWLFIAATALCALAVMPGSLGVLALTNDLAAGSGGARFIYGRIGEILIGSAVVLTLGVRQASLVDGFSTLTMIATAAYLGILGFGFVMHTSLMFKPIKEPVFISLDAAIQKFGPDEEIIGVTDGGGQAFAIITRLARRPHIVHQPDGDTPFVMTHCILSHSSMAYAAEGKFHQPEFSVAAALANNLVIYDSRNDCAISQIQNRSRDGALAPVALPTVATSLSSWQALYPESRVGIRPFTWRDAFFLKALSRGEMINPASPKLLYPLQRPRDARLGLKSLVIGVRVGEASKAYPVPMFEHRQTINDTIGGTAVLIASAFDGDYIQVFDRDLDDMTLTFRNADNGEGFIDQETGSRFSPHGRCVSGAYEGRALRAIPHFNKIFWFPWADYFPETEVYSAQAQVRSA